MFREYPYLNLQDLNLDYILRKIREMQTELNNFVVTNAIKYADPIDWNITTQYEKNTVVIDANSGIAYLSVQPVPSGVAITNTDYWTVIFDLSMFIDKNAKNLTDHVEGQTNTATFNSAVGDWLIWYDVLYKVIAPITAGDAYVENSNIEKVTVEDYIQSILTEIAKMGDLDNLVTTNKDTLVDAINENHEIYNVFVTPEMFGALGDGVTDDSAAIQSAIDSGKRVVFATKAYLVANSLILKPNTELDLGSCIIKADVAGYPVFKTVTDGTYGTSRIYIHGVDAIVNGNAESIFEFNGTNRFDLSPSNYARDIRIDHIHGSSNNITNFIKMNVAVRDMFVSNCSTYTNNGIVSNAKGVEIMIHDCLLYINTVGYPIKLESDQGTRYYNEGWSILNSTIDGPEGSEISIADVYTFEIANCYIGSHIKINEPTTTTHTRDVIINGNMISGNVNIGNDSATTHAFYASISANIIMGRVFITRGAQLHVVGNTFDTYPDTPSVYAIQLKSNIEKAVIEGNTIDASFSGGIIAQSYVSESCIHDNTYYGTGYGVTLQTNTAVVTVHDNVGGSSDTDIIQAISGTFAVSDTIVTVPVVLGKGQRGFIRARLELSAVADPNAQFAIGLPANVDIPKGSGWTSGIIRAYNQQFVDIMIPYRTTADTTGNVTIVNYQGASVTIGSHSWIDIIRS